MAKSKEFNHEDQPDRKTLALWLRMSVKSLEEVRGLYPPESIAGRIIASALKGIPSVEQIDQFNLE